MQHATTSIALPARLERRLPELYLVLALLLTSLTCVLTAPFFAPDEPDQSARAMELGHAHLLGRFGLDEDGNRQAGDDIDANAIAVMGGMDSIRMTWERKSGDFHNRSYGPVTAQDQQRFADVRWAHHRIFLPFQNTAVYPPALYLPAIVGWRSAEAANLTIFQGLRLARLLSAFTAVILGWLALRLCACSRWILLPFLLLPSTLFLNAGSSQDAVLLSVAALVAAMLSRPLVAHREFNHAELAVIALLIALCGTARPPYVALALLLFVPGIELPKKPLRSWRPVLIAAVTTLATAAAWRHLVTALGIESADEADPIAQQLFLRTHPFAGGWAVLRGTWEAGVDFVHRGLYIVGWNDLQPPHWLVVLLAVALLVILLCAPACPPRSNRGRLLLALAVAGALLGISMAEYIIWTPPGLHTVYGIQPRYWLPLLPLATMLLQGLFARYVPAKNILLPLATATLALVACTLPWTVSHAFYRDTVAHVLRLNLR